MGQKFRELVVRNNTCGSFGGASVENLPVRAKSEGLHPWVGSPTGGPGNPLSNSAWKSWTEGHPATRKEGSPRVKDDWSNQYTYVEQYALSISGIEQFFAHDDIHLSTKWLVSNILKIHNLEKLKIKTHTENESSRFIQPRNVMQFYLVVFSQYLSMIDFEIHRFLCGFLTWLTLPRGRSQVNFVFISITDWPVNSWPQNICKAKLDEQKWLDFLWKHWTLLPNSGQATFQLKGKGTFNEQSYGLIVSTFDVYRNRFWFELP